MSSLNHNSTHTESPDVHESVKTAQSAADGDTAARTEITTLVNPIITFQTTRFCKRFCKENRFNYQCTLDSSWGTTAGNAVYCEWGNASYAWMLDDLTNANRLRKFGGLNGARINDYLFRIANSLPFYERWKDWRFGRKVHVPTYIQAMSPDAHKIFLAIRGGDNTALIAQKLGKPENYVDHLAQCIITELTTRNRLYLLDPPATVSLSNYSSENNERAGAVQHDIPSFDAMPETEEQANLMRLAWDQLSAPEQFVLEAMVVEEQDASDILAALKTLNIAIKDGVSAQDTDRQQLYYFRRKTLAKLATLYETLSNN